jgi:hypothetical protein
MDWCRELQAGPTVGPKVPNAARTQNGLYLRLVLRRLLNWWTGLELDRLAAKPTMHPSNHPWSGAQRGAHPGRGRRGELRPLPHLRGRGPAVAGGRPGRAAVCVPGAAGGGGGEGGPAGCSSHRITPSLAGSQPTPIVRRVTNMPVSLSSLIGTSAVHFRTELIPVPTLRSRWREHKQWVKWTENDMRQRKSEWHETESGMRRRKPK